MIEVTHQTLKIIFSESETIQIFFLSFIFQSINVHQRKDTRRGVVNNQILDWSFKLDGIFNNAAQDQVFETVGADIVTSALDGYNGKNQMLIILVINIYFDLDIFTL